MKAITIFTMSIALTSGILVIAFPFYLILFISKRIKSKMLNYPPHPSVLTLVVYLVMISFSLSLWIPTYRSLASHGDKTGGYIWYMHYGPQPFILAVACFWTIWCLVLDERRWRRAIKEKSHGVA